MFAGQKVDPSIEGGELWLCGNCGSMFKYPTLSSKEYLSLYEKSPGSVWEGQSEIRNDYSIISSYLLKHAGGTILDIGCHSGSFLDCLPDKFEKYGIEPSKLAAQVATSRGIKVLGKTLEEIEADKLFDIVVAIDVIEHVLDVENFMNLVLPHMKQNGIFILSTGNPECFAWKSVFQSKFWYSMFAEHLTFPSYRYFKEYSRRKGLKVPNQIRFRYIDVTLAEQISRIFKVFPIVLPSPAYNVLRRIFRLLKGDYHLNPPSVPTNLIGTFYDHQVVIITK